MEVVLLFDVQLISKFYTIHFAVTNRCVNMEWGTTENRIAVIALHKCKKTAVEIFKLLKPLKITQKFVYRTIKRYNELSSVNDRPRAGRPRTIRTPAAIKAIWWGVSYEGVTKLHFCEQGVKTRAINYQSDILEKVVKPVSNTLFAGKQWIFQQDSAPAHKAKSTQRWLDQNLTDFIASEDWPPASPDLNPLDYCLWNILEEKACSKPHRNIESLKANLVKVAASIPLDVIRAAIDEWPGRLEKCVKAKGGHFE